VREALPRILKVHLGGTLESVFPMPGGREKYLVRAFGGSEPLILRVYATAERARLHNALKANQLVAREAPTYKIVGFDATGQHAPFLYTLSHMLWGADALSVIETGILDEEDMKRVGIALGGAFGSIHLVKAEGFGEPRLPAHQRDSKLSAAVLGVIEEATREAEAKGEMEPGAFERIAAIADPMFDLLDGSEEEGTLVHGNATPSSVIVKKEEGRYRLTGVCSLGRARFLDPAYDLATLETETFSEYPALKEPFYRAYRARRPLPAELETKITLYGAIRSLF
jgi:hypothetical protein